MDRYLVSVYIDPALAKKVKHRAVSLETTIKSIVEEALYLSFKYYFKAEIAEKKELNDLKAIERLEKELADAQVDLDELLLDRAKAKFKREEIQARRALKRGGA